MPPLNAAPVATRSRKGKPDRFDRFTPSGAITVRLTAEDLDLLRLVERCRLIDSRQLALTVGRIANRRAFLNRLKNLFHSRHLTRPKSQLNRWWTKGEPTLAYCYGLGPAGYVALHPDAGDESNAVLRLRDQRIGAQYITHRLLLTEALLCFEHAALAEGWSLTWSEGDDFRAHTGLTRYVSVPTSKRAIELPLNPDSFVTLTTDGPGSETRYFIELDNGTEPITRTGSQRWQRTSIHRKFVAYDALAPRKHDTDRRTRAPFPFRVLTITTTPARMESMRELCRDLDPKQRGQRLYLFTTHDRITLHRFADVLTEAIWWTPNDDDQPVALSD